MKTTYSVRLGGGYDSPAIFSHHYMSPDEIYYYEYSSDTGYSWFSADKPRYWYRAGLETPSIGEAVALVTEYLEMSGQQCKMHKWLDLL